MYDHLIVPTDGSETANRAVEHAVELAKRHGSTVEAVYMVDPSFPGPTSPWKHVEGALEEMREDGRQRLQGAVDRTGDVEIETAVVEHDGVAEGVLECAREANADAIVMGIRALGRRADRAG
jgi:nucleotide-binding universal stress UspA family protein